MANIRIVTDDAADLSPSLLKSNHIHSISLPQEVVKKAWKQSVSTLFPSPTLQRGGSLFPHPPVLQIVAAYERLQQHDPGSLILSIHHSSRLSPLIAQVLLAQRLVSHRMKVIVFDTLTTSAALGYLVLKAAELVRQGATLEEVLFLLEEERESLRLHLFPTHPFQLPVAAGSRSKYPLCKQALRLLPKMTSHPLGYFLLQEWGWHGREPAYWFQSYLQKRYPERRLLYASREIERDLPAELTFPLPQLPLNPHIRARLGGGSLAIVSTDKGER